MSDFLSQLVTKNFDQAEVLQPRPLSLFEPLPTTEGAAFPASVSPAAVETEPFTGGPAAEDLASIPAPAWAPPAVDLAVTAPEPVPQPPANLTALLNPRRGSPTDQMPSTEPAAIRPSPPPSTEPPPLAGEPANIQQPKPVPLTSPSSGSGVSSEQALSQVEESKVDRPAGQSVSRQLPPAAEPSKIQHLKSKTDRPPPAPAPATIAADETETRSPRSTLRPKRHRPEPAPIPSSPDATAQLEAPSLSPAPARPRVSPISASLSPMEAQAMPGTMSQTTEDRRPAAVEPAQPASSPLAALEPGGVIAQPQVRAMPPIEPIEPAAPANPEPVGAPEPAGRPEPPPTVQVTIGRIEVRATPPPSKPKKQPSRPPVMSLDDYLRRRNQGGER